MSQSNNVMIIDAPRVLDSYAIKAFKQFTLNLNVTP